MSPISVIQRPIKWFNAIRDYKATVSGGPNFMYEACVKRIRDKQLEDCDLSSWTTAFNGAEPINNEVLEQFSQRFEKYGYKRTTHLPCYGMAETTLIVSGSDFDSEPVVKYFNKEFLHKDKALVTTDDKNSQPLVSCGKAASGLTVKIVDPESFKELHENQIGEVWVKGDSIAKGYWQKAPVSGQDFVGILDGDPEDRYFRTGDLAFIHEGEIYITGRIKDLIIVRGKNHYPQDIEATTTKSSDRLKPHTTAAFSVNDEGTEKLVLLQEIDRRAELSEKKEVHAAIKEAIAEEHGIQLHDIVFIRPGALPKTTSGKIQRGLARKVYLEQYQVEKAVIDNRRARKVTE
jgi:acyl-CoA synthetase (AMP-forming)/AMP-acid ligase II